MNTNKHPDTQIHCPRCKNIKLEDLILNVYCTRCNLTFYKEFLKRLEDDEVLANEELDGIVQLFKDDPHFKC